MFVRIKSGSQIELLNEKKLVGTDCRWTLIVVGFAFAPENLQTEQLGWDEAGLQQSADPFSGRAC